MTCSQLCLRIDHLQDLPSEFYVKLRFIRMKFRLDLFGFLGFLSFLRTLDGTITIRIEFLGNFRRVPVRLDRLHHGLFTGSQRTHSAIAGIGPFLRCCQTGYHPLHLLLLVDSIPCRCPGRKFEGILHQCPAHLFR